MSAQEREDLVARLQAVLRASSSDTDSGIGGEAGGTATMAPADTVAAVLEGVHPADIAEAMDRMPDEDALTVFHALDNARAAEVLDELDADTARYLLDHDVPGRIADLLDILPMDDAAEVVADIQESSPERAEELLQELSARAPEDAEEVRELLSYREQTAGRLMTDRFVRLTPEMSVEDAFAAIRKSDPEVETLADLYVVERTSSGRELLFGVLSLRGLVRAEPTQRISEIMTSDPITVTVDTDQEEVAQMISKYDFNALPVLDRQGALVGIVTVDDVVDILVEEQTEDVLKQGAVEPGVVDMPYFSVPITKAVRSRVTWLVLLFIAETATTAVLHQYEDELQKVTELAVYIPLLIGTGGNTGAQTVSTVIRALSLKEIRWADAWRVLGKEMLTGLLLGLLLGIVALGRTLLYKKGVDLAFVIALAVWAICAWANIIAALVPLVAQRFKIDPALVSAPLITTLVDATGLAIYLYIAKLILVQLQ
jgi:magnesium transporter